MQVRKSCSARARHPRRPYSHHHQRGKGTFLIPGHRPRMTHLFLVPPLWTLEWVVRGYVGIHRARKAIQVDGCRPRRMSLRRFPRLFPIRNPCELRGLYRRSYFGPRTCARKECAKLNIVCLSPEQFLCPTIPLSKLAATELPYHEMNPLTCLMSVTSVSTVPVDYQ